MRRFTVSLSVIVIVLLGSVVAWGSGTSAQEPFATPGPGSSSSSRARSAVSWLVVSSQSHQRDRSISVSCASPSPRARSSPGRPTTPRSASIWLSRVN